MRPSVRTITHVITFTAAISSCRQTQEERTGRSAQALHATPGGADILTFHGSNARTGWNRHETTLTPDNVRPQTFGLIAVAPDVSDEVAGQPLFASNIPVHDGRSNTDTMADVVFVGTMDNRVYALDSDNLETLWSFDFEGHRPPLASALQACQSDYHIGVMSTPVISADRTLIYAVGRVQGSGPTDAWLQGYVLRTRDGSIAAKFRVGETVGTDGVTRIPLTFDGTDRGTPVHLQYEPNQNTQRSALLLEGNRLYVANGGICDTPGFRGWIFAYDTTTLSETARPVATFVPSPGGGGGMWAAGGPASDGTSLFIATGNGHANIRAGVPAAQRSFASALLRTGLDLGFDGNACFAISGGACGAGDASNLSNVFMGRNAELQSQDEVANSTDDIQGPDEDFGSSGPLLVPSAELPENMPGDMGRHLAALGGKDGFFYLIDRDHMGGIGPSPLATDADFNNLVGAELDGHEVFMHSTSGGIRLTAAFYESRNGRYLYVNGADPTTASDAPQGTVAFRIVPGVDPTPEACRSRFRATALHDRQLPCPTIWGANMRPTLEVAWSGTGGTLAGSPFVSSNDHENGIVWSTLERGGTEGNGVLVAYPADSGPGTGAQIEPIYRSDRVPSDRVPGPATTFAGPIVANGRVYVTGSTFIATYGPVAAREVPPVPDPPAPPDCAPGVTWESTAQQFMTHYCVDCHSEYTRLGFIQRRHDRVAESILPMAGGTPRMPLVHDPAMPPPLPTDEERTAIAAWLRCGAPATTARMHAGFNDIDAAGGAFLGDGMSLDPNHAGTLSGDRLMNMPVTNLFAPAYPDTLFHTDRTGALQLRVPIPGTGHYAVTMLFAENACTTGGPECNVPFDVRIAGQPWLTGFDILGAAGGPRRVVARSTTVDVANGSQLRIDVAAGGKYQAVEVVRTEACTTDMQCPLGFACQGGMCAVNAERADGGVGGDAGVREDGVMVLPDGAVIGPDGAVNMDGGIGAENGMGGSCHCHVAGSPRSTSSSRAWLGGAFVALAMFVSRRRRNAIASSK